MCNKIHYNLVWRENMQHAYLIMAHSDFYLLQKLIQVIDNPNGDIFLHLDAKNKYANEDIKKLKESVKYSQLHIYSQIPVIWGSKTQIDCELFNAASNLWKLYILPFIVRSGFLVKTGFRYSRIFQRNNGREFLAVDTNPLNRELMIERIDHYHWIFNKRYLTMRFNQLSRPVEKCLGIHRLNDKERACFAKGMNWASMTKPFLQCILREQEKIQKMARHTLCFDEMYKQMIYMAHQNEFQLYKGINLSEANIQTPRCQLEADATMHKVDWERGTPYTYRMSDYNELISSHCCFARKFNSSIDRNIIDKLYEYVIKN